MGDRLCPQHYPSPVFSDLPTALQFYESVATAVCTSSLLLLFNAKRSVLLLENYQIVEDFVNIVCCSLASMNYYSHLVLSQLAHLMLFSVSLPPPLKPSLYYVSKYLHFF